MSPIDDRVDHAGETRSKSWNLDVPDGSFATVIAWHSGQSWFDALLDALATNAGEETRRAAKVAPDTLLKVARADWLVADADTGRGVSTAHETVAAQLGMSAKTVQRARLLLEALGFAVTVVRGRYLTAAERRAARAVHGGRQIRAASVRALTLPRPAQSVVDVSLPRRGNYIYSPHVKERSPKRAEAPTATAPRSQRRKNQNSAPKVPRSTHARTAPRPLGVQRLAAQLVRRVRWLDSGKHLGALCDVLEATGLDAQEWSADDVVEVMNSFFKERRMDCPTRMQSPLGFLRWVLSLAIDPGVLTPAQKRARSAAERKARLAQRDQEREQESQRVAAIDQAEVARIIAASNAEISTRARPDRSTENRTARWKTGRLRSASV